MRSILVIAAALLALSGCRLAGSPPASPEEGLRIAAWNIEHLTAEAGAGCAPRSEAELDLIGEYIRAADADIWLLQEVDGEAALRRVFGEGWIFHVEARAGAGDYPLCRGREDGARLRAQNTAIAVRDTVAHQRLADLSALDVAGNARMRHGVVISLTDWPALDIMSVHLKSGCFAGDEAEACPVLYEQAGIVESWIDARSAAGRSVIIGGDFNRRLASDSDPVWADLNDGDPSPLHIAGAGTGPACDPRYSAFIDFILLNEAAHALKRQGSFRELLFTDEARLSDHCPVLIDIERGQ